LLGGPTTRRGPGDQHSQQEWVWRKADYQRLFEPAPTSSMRGESTPFYLWHRAAQRRISEQLRVGRPVRALLTQLTGESFDDWLSTESRGSLRERSRAS